MYHRNIVGIFTHKIAHSISNSTLIIWYKTGITGMVIKLALAIYNICWHILHIYSNVNNTEYMYLSHMLRYNVMTTPFWMTYTLYWYTAVIYSSMSYTESMYHLHNFRPENFINPGCSIFYKILLCKWPQAILYNHLIILYKHSLPFA